jgi:hypothetical protein
MVVTIFNKIKIISYKYILCILVLLIFMAKPIHSEIEVGSFLLNSILHFGSGVAEFLNVENQADENMNLRARQEKYEGKDIKILRVNFANLAPDYEAERAQTAGLIQGLTTDPFADVEPAVIGPALCYPNPFRQQDGGKLGYRLSKNMDMEVHIYDMLARRVFQADFNAGSQGGMAGYNKVILNNQTFDGNIELSAGVYFYLLIYEGDVLARGKMAVIP